MVMEECPLNRYTPQQDEYRPIESEDEIAGNHDDNSDFGDEDKKKEHYDLLIAAVNGEPNPENAAADSLSTRKNASQRLTRSRVARIRSSIVPPKHNSKPPFQ